MAELNAGVRRFFEVLDPAWASRVTVMMGNAAIKAAESVKAKMAEAAAAQLDTIPDRLVFAHHGIEGELLHRFQKLSQGSVIVG